jgi:hypothetical protein
MTIGALILAAVLVAIVIVLLLRRQLREKYAVVWLVIGLAALVLGLFPQLLTWLTAALGFQVPANLLFTLAIVLLLAVTLHQSWELTKGEEEIRRLAEEAAISRQELKDLRTRVQNLERPVSRREDEAPGAD